MNIATMSIRELSRYGSSIKEYDYVKVINKKTNTFNGVFVSSKYAKEIEEFLKNKIEKEKQEKIDKLNSFAGILSGEIGDGRVGDIKRKYAN